MQKLLDAIAKAREYAAIALRSKAYLAGLGLILGGAGMIAVELAAAPDVPSMIAVAQGIPASEGFRRILEGLGILGVRHAIAKQGEPNAAPQNPPTA